MKKSWKLQIQKFFQNKIDCIGYDLENVTTFSEDFINNINSIMSNKLNIKLHYSEKVELDYILKRIYSWSNLEFPKCLSHNSFIIEHGFLYNYWEICFFNTTVCAISNEQFPIFIRWKILILYYKANEIHDKSCFARINSGENLNNNLNFLHLKDLSRLEIIDWSFEENKDKAKLFQNELETCLTESDKEWEFVIPTNCLEHFKINDDQASRLLKNENWKQFLKEISKVTKIYWSIGIANLVKNIDQYISLL